MADELEDLRRRAREAEEREQQAIRREQQATRREQQATRQAQVMQAQLAEEQRQAQEMQAQLAEEQRQTQEVQAQLAEVQLKLRSTTLQEYLSLCHERFTLRMRVQHPMKSTKGSITAPKNRPCPRCIKPWKDFPDIQLREFDVLLRALPSDGRYFTSTEGLDILCREFNTRFVASEDDLEFVQRLTVENPVSHVFSQLSKVEGLGMDVGEGVQFDNHVHNLSDRNPDNQEMESDRQGVPRHADQICVFKRTDGSNMLCQLVEYKAPHKLSILSLRAGLQRADAGSMDFQRDVLSQVTTPTDPEEKFVSRAEWLVGAVTTQIYSYMIESGLHYSYITTGQAFIFVKIDAEEPHTLYYHLAEPKEEVGEGDDMDIRFTAVGQVAAFTMLAMNSRAYSQEWRNYVCQTAPRATVDFQELLRRIPYDKDTMAPPASAFKARGRPVDRSPINLRPRKKTKKTKTGCRGETVEDTPSPRTSSDEPDPAGTPSRAGPRIERQGEKPPRGHRNDGSSNADRHPRQQQRQYCTQACLLGLARGEAFDGACPNISDHRKNNQGHLKLSLFINGFLQQFNNDPEDGCEPLDKAGARGALFRLTLQSHGYCFVGKGTVDLFEKCLQHESDIYEHLHTLQGNLIPVCLGYVHLSKIYFLDVGVRIRHMLLMSWAGEEVMAWDLPLYEEARQATARLRQLGVEHMDVRDPNILTLDGRLMLIDFERSELITSPKTPKRKRLVDDEPLQPRSAPALRSPLALAENI